MSDYKELNLVSVDRDKQNRLVVTTEVRYLFGIIRRKEVYMSLGRYFHHQHFWTQLPNAKAVGVYQASQLDRMVMAYE